MKSNQIHNHLLTLCKKHRVDQLSMGYLFGWYMADIYYTVEAKDKFNPSLIGFEMNLKKLIKLQKEKQR